MTAGANDSLLLLHVGKVYSIGTNPRGSHTQKCTRHPKTKEGSFLFFVCILSQSDLAHHRVHVTLRIGPNGHLQGESTVVRESFVRVNGEK